MVLDHGDAPDGILFYQLLPHTREIFLKVFGEKQEFRIKNHRPIPAIEALYLMGSIGSIAYTDKSDFDYWVVIRDDLSEGEQEALDAKLRAIESFCEHKLKVEVHFFPMKASDLLHNRFGEVSQESCGSAQALLLKEEFYRGSLHIAGEVPLWWICPAGTSQEAYDATAAYVRDDDVWRVEPVIDMGNIGDIPNAEFLGAGLWQLNKGIDSPFKSLLKMALLLYYRSEGEAGWICEQLKELVHRDPRKMNEVDPYQIMMDRLLAFHGEDKDVSQTLRICFFLKIGIRISLWMSQKKEPPELKQRVVLKYVNDWEWSRRDVEDWEEVSSLPLYRILELKQRIEVTMLRGLQELMDGVTDQALLEVMGEQDLRRLVHRVVSVYDSSRRRVEWFYPPYDQSLMSRSFTILRMKEGDYRLYRGEVDTRQTSYIEEKSFLSTFSKIEDLGVWMVYNLLIESETSLYGNFEGLDRFLLGLKDMARVYREHFGRPHTPPLDGAFVHQPVEERWVLCIRLLEREEKDDLAQPRPYRANDRRQLESPSDGLWKNMKEGLGDIVHHLEGKRRRLEEFYRSEPWKGKEGDGGRRTGSQKLPPGQDPLNLGKEEEDLCREPVLLIMNSWSEVSVRTLKEPRDVLEWMVRMLQRALKKQMKPSELTDISVGAIEGDRRQVLKRWKRLIQQLDLFFFSSRLEDEVPKAFFFQMGGRTYRIVSYHDFFTGVEVHDLSMGFMELQLDHPGRIHLYLDVDYPRWVFFRLAMKTIPHGHNGLAFHKGTTAKHVLVKDHTGHVLVESSVEMELEHRLARCYQDLLLSIQKNAGDESADSEAPRAYIFTRGKKGEAALEDITGKVKKMTGHNEEPSENMDFILTWSSAVALLRHYLHHHTWRVDSGVFLNEVRGVLEKIERLRGESDQMYRPYLQDVMILHRPEHSGWSAPCVDYLVKGSLERLALELARRPGRG